ncbi:MAG: DUF971 family protein [Myxococcota bacterium]|jgi:DUF971 family protein
MVDWSKDPEPDDLRWEDDNTTVGIMWNDGHASKYRLEYLRRICPCAVCRDSHAHPPIRTDAKPFQILNAVQVQVARGSSKVRSVEPIGNYAISFVWSDGHDDGIYSYRFMRSMCPCDECTATLKDSRSPEQQALVDAAKRETVIRPIKIIPAEAPAAEAPAAEAPAAEAPAAEAKE